MIRPKLTDFENENSRPAVNRAIQLAYDLWQAKRRAKKLRVKQFFASAPG